MIVPHKRILELTQHMHRMCKELAEIAKSQLDNEEFVRVQELAGIKKSREELEEKWGVQTTVSPSEKGKYEGKTKAELLKSYNALKKSGPHHKGSKEYGRMRELAFAIRAKGDWGKVKDE